MGEKKFSVCHSCGEEFEVYGNRRKYCSEVCSHKKIPKVKKCVVCGIDFEATGASKTCSNECKSSMRKTTLSSNQELYNQDINIGSVVVLRSDIDRLHKMTVLEISEEGMAICVFWGSDETLHSMPVQPILLRRIK